MKKIYYKIIDTLEDIWIDRPWIYSVVGGTALAIYAINKYL